jgi:hypothetical protein
MCFSVAVIAGTRRADAQVRTQRKISFGKKGYRTAAGNADADILPDADVVKAEYRHFLSESFIVYNGCLKIPCALVALPARRDDR